MDPAPPPVNDFDLQDNVVMENVEFTTVSWPEYLAPYNMGGFSNLDDITTEMDIENENKSTPTFAIPSGALPDLYLQPLTYNALPFVQQFAPSVVPPSDQLFTSSSTPSLATPFVRSFLPSTQPLTPISTSASSSRCLEEVNLRVEKFGREDPPSNDSICIGSGMTDITNEMDIDNENKSTPCTFTILSGVLLDQPPTDNALLFAQQFAPSVVPQPLDLLFTSSPTPSLFATPPATPPVRPDDTSYVASFLASTTSPTSTSSCHHCKSTTQIYNSRKTSMASCTNERCQKTYCYECLDKYYDDPRHVSPECKYEICPACRGGCSESFSGGWDCPSCRNICACKACRRGSRIWHILSYHLRDKKSYKFLTNQLRDGTYNPEIIVTLQKLCQKSVMNALFTQLTITPIQTMKIGRRMDRYLSCLRSITVKKLICSPRPDFDGETVLKLNLECLSVLYNVPRGLPFGKLSFILENLTAPRFECICSETKAQQIIEVLQNNVFVVECLLRPKHVPTHSGDRIFRSPELVRIVSQNRAWQKKYEISCFDDFRRAFSASILEGSEEHTYVPRVLCALIASFLV